MTGATHLDERGLYAFFDRHGIAHARHAHPPLMTVEDSRALRGELPGTHVKNMFLKEKKGGLWLVTCLEVGAKATSFGKPELLWEALGVRPGAVTPFAAVNDRERRVGVVLDRAVLAEPGPVNAHPLHNEATATVAPGDLLRVFELTGHAPRIVDFDALEALARERETGETG